MYYSNLGLMKSKKALLLILFLTATLYASPLQPWDKSVCADIRQNDNLKIGAICGKYNSQLRVLVLDVYYFGFLAKNDQDFKGLIASLSVNHSPFRPMGMKKETFGDGYNLPKKDVYHATYIATNSFQEDSEYPFGKDFAIYFLAEEKKPLHNPPLSEDNLYGVYYRGKIGRAEY